MDETAAISREPDPSCNAQSSELAELETQETDRLLLAWTEVFRAKREEVGAVVSSLAELDELQAAAEQLRAKLTPPQDGGES